MSDNNIRRRDVLKKTAVASALPMTMGVASAQQSGSEDDIKITETTGISPDEVTEDIQGITNYDGTESLTARIEDETGYEMDDGFAVGIDLETDDETLNEHNPRIIHIPVKPSGVDDVSTVESTEGTVPSQSEFSIDNGGVLMALTVRVEGERTPATLMGMTREKSPSSSSLAKGSEEVDTKSFVIEDGSGKIHQERTGQQPMKSDWQSKVGRNTSTVTPMDTQFTCWGCATVVGVACAGASTLSMTSCASAAVSSGVFSPWAGAAVSAFCMYIVANAGTLNCALGAAAICDSVTNDCSFLE